jgi:hypothetical protein
MGKTVPNWWAIRFIPAAAGCDAQGSVRRAGAGAQIDLFENRLKAGLIAVSCAKPFQTDAKGLKGGYHERH